ncbi:MAG: glutamate-1-semialdehyde 2,1-aminomutase [Bacteroidetes bacterium]|nr:glutamate-1-semialdehyde 2,1-aminomutase [Bacteroidota bacterium]
MNLTQTQSLRLFDKSRAIIPGGVNSPVRAFGSVGGNPRFIEKAMGAYLYDADGQSYVDFINSWGPMILGHAFEPIVEAVNKQLEKGFSFGAPTEQELEMAEMICQMAPGVEMVRLVSSGTEACMSALRLARGYTKKNKFIKFAGCYHGHADPFLVKAGSGLMSFGIPGSAGVPTGATQDTLIAEFNDLATVEALFREYGEEMAAVIVEPVAGNMGCIVPEKGFLEGLRKVCSEHGAVLIFDEVMTGFRLAQGGASERLGIDADLYCYGKVIGGGMPVGAFGGKKQMMEYLAPIGPVYQAGTLSGNPIAVSCGLATLRYLNENKQVYSDLDAQTASIENIIHENMKDKVENYCVNRMGSMISLHFSKQVSNYSEAQQADNTTFNKLFHHLLNEGVYLPPSAFETWFVSAAVGDLELDRLSSAFKSFQTEP